MIKVAIAKLAQVIKGRLIIEPAQPDASVRGVVWDSRAVESGCVFLAMPGERVDGNDYVVSAVEAGTGAVVCTRALDEGALDLARSKGCAVIHVEDGIVALQNLAGYWRDCLNAHVIGITGSTGKTSTKDFVASVLSRAFKTTATVGNYNNEIGVPATILSSDADTQALAVEMGMRGLGQIELLCSFARPDFGIVTNVGVSHLELLKTRDNIARAKSELVSALPQGGVAILNADDPYTDRLVEFSHAKERGVQICTYGVDTAARVRAVNIVFDREARASFDLVIESETVHVRLGIAGRHNVGNALAAAAIGHTLGMPLDDIAQGLAEAQGSGMRMEVMQAPRGITVVNDAYNANPDSMKASLATLQSMECGNHRIAVLGDMGELGPDEAALHAQVGASAAHSDLDLLVCVGQLAEQIACGAQEAGMEDEKILCFSNVEEASAKIIDMVEQDDIVLVKASRFMGMERIVKEIAF